MIVIPSTGTTRKLPWTPSAYHFETRRFTRRETRCPGPAHAGGWHGRLRRRWLTVQNSVNGAPGHAKPRHRVWNGQLLAKDNFAPSPVPVLGCLAYWIPANVGLENLFPLGKGRLDEVLMLSTIDAPGVLAVEVLSVLQPATALGASPGWGLVGTGLGQGNILKNVVLIDVR